MRVFSPVFAFVALSAFAALVALLCLCSNAVQAAGAELKTDSPSVYQIFFNLKRANTEEHIDKVFWDISTPGNARYRQFLSHEQLKQLVAAPRSVASRARHYLETEAGCSRVEELKTGDTLVCTLDKKQGGSSLKMALALEQQFATADLEQKGIYRIDVSNKMPLQLRKLLRSAVAFRPVNRAVKGTSLKNALKKQNNNNNKNVGEPGMTQTPYTINQRYSVPHSSTFPPLARNVTVAVGEFEGEYFTPSDLVTFAQKYNLGQYRVEIMGGNTPSGADATEGTLDNQYVLSPSNATLPLLWAEGSSNNNDPGNLDFTSWIDKLLARSNVPAVVSISWGMGDYNYVFDPALLVQDNDAFRKAGLVGVTLMAASGDSGVGVRREVLQCKKFSPSWPASSPYLTAVGATYANSQSGVETSVDWSGGGFSDSFARPQYQMEAVNNYLHTNTKLPASSYYNASGRGYPDVSALGTNYNIVVAGQWEPVSGTSCASPTFAGIVALIIAERVAAGKPAFGFLNPTLYKLGHVGYDVVNGQNQDTNCIPFVPIEGFAAQKGWDPVSGLGTPNYEFLRQNL